MNRCGLVLCAVAAVAAVTAGLTGCDGSSDPAPSSSSPPPVTIAPCPATVAVPSDTTQVAPSSSVPPTTVIRTGDALSVEVPAGATLGLGAPVQRADLSVLCRASSPTGGRTELVGRASGFVRLVVASSGRQRVVNIQVTV